MHIDQKAAVSGTFIVLPGEVATIPLPDGPLANVMVKSQGGEPQIKFEDGKVLLIDLGTTLGTSAKTELTHPGGKLSLRLYVSANAPEDLHTVHYTAVAN